MSLPYRQQWQLRQIDHALRRSDPHLAAMLGCVVLFGICAARGMGRAAGRMVAGVGWLLRVPLLRSARPGPGTTAPELRRNS